MKWSGLIRPPQLQHTDTDSGDERTATLLELIFDLAFVLVVAELAVGLGDDRTLGGVLVFAGLFTSVWWAWAAGGGAGPAVAGQGGGQAPHRPRRSRP